MAFLKETNLIRLLEHQGQEASVELRAWRSRRIGPTSDVFPTGDSRLFVLGHFSISPVQRGTQQILSFTVVEIVPQR